MPIDRPNERREQSLFKEWTLLIHLLSEEKTIHSTEKQDGNVPSRRHILGSKIFKEQLLEIFGKKFFFPKKVFGKKVAQCRKI